MPDFKHHLCSPFATDHHELVAIPRGIMLTFPSDQPWRFMIHRPSKPMGPFNPHLTKNVCIKMVSSFLRFWDEDTKIYALKKQHLV